MPSEAPAEARVSAAIFIARACAAISLLVGVLVLIGWVLAIDILRSPLAREVSMKPNTALSFLVLGASLLLLRAGGGDRRLLLAGRVLASVPGAIAVLTLAEYAFERDLGIDELLFHDTTAAIATVVPGRPAPLTAVCFLLLSCGLLVLDLRRGAALAQLCGFVAGFVGLLGLIPYLYGLHSSSGLIARETQMAVHTALAIVVLGTGVVLARPDGGPMAFVGSDTIGGSLARRLLPVSVGLPVAVGWLSVGGQRVGLYDADYRVSLVATASAAALTVLTLIGARSAHQVDLRRRQAERTRADLFRLNPGPAFMNRLQDGCFVDVNEAFVRAFGWTRDEIIGRSSLELNLWPSPEDREAVLRALAEHGIAEAVEATFLDRSGRSMPMLLSARSIGVDGVEHVVGTLLDVTELKLTEELLRRSVARTEGLNAIAREILAAGSTGELARMGLSRLRKIVPCMRASVARLDAGAKELVLIAVSSDDETRAAEGTRFPLSSAGSAGELLRGEIHLVPDTSEVTDPDPSSRLLIDEGVRTYVSIPMLVGGELIATLNLSRNTRDGFTEDDLAVAREVGDMLALALVQAELRDEQRRQNEILEERVAVRTAALSESETRFRSVLANAPDGVLLVDPAGVIVLANDTASTLFGYEVIELHGLRVEELVPESLRTIHETYRERHASEHVTRPMGTGLGLRGRRKDGTEFPADISLSSIPPDVGRGPDVIAFVRDVTERKGIESDLLAAMEDAERANRAKDEFLSRMSHELRTPLNAVLGFAQVLEMEDLPPEQRDSVRQILKGGRHLLELIDEVLDISRIASGRLPLSLEPVGVSDALQDVVALVRPLADQRRITLRLADPDGLHVLADRQKLTQVLLNLLSNAIKYNREKGSVEIAWGRGPEGRLRIGVSDTGSGIDPEQLEKVFVPFDRLGAEAGRIEGTGLGLSLSKALIEGMGGTLQVQSQTGVGSIFTVDLALAEPPTERYERERREHGAIEDRGSARTVLYVEDNLSNLQLIEQVLRRRAQVKLITAGQGSLGIDLAREHRPDLILLDLHLPDIDGKEVLRRLRGHPATAGIPVIVISADATPAQITTVLAAGARDYLTKPIDVRKLLDRVVEVLRPAEVESGGGTEP